MYPGSVLQTTGMAAKAGSYEGKMRQSYQNGQSSWNGSTSVGEIPAGSGGSGHGKEGQGGRTGSLAAPRLASESPSQTCRQRLQAGAAGLCVEQRLTGWPVL